MVSLLLFVFMTIILLICFYVNSRLFVYIKNLEVIVQEQINKNENMYQSLKDLVQDGFLLSDGRLKKMLFQKEKNRIYNGVSVEENDVEI